MFLFRSDLARRAMEDKNLPSGLYSDLLEGRTCFVCLKVSKQLAHRNTRSANFSLNSHQQSVELTVQLMVLD